MSVYSRALQTLALGLDLASQNKHYRCSGCVTVLFCPTATCFHIQSLPSLRLRNCFSRKFGYRAFWVIYWGSNFPVKGLATFGCKNWWLQSRMERLYHHCFVLVIIILVPLGPVTDWRPVTYSNKNNQSLVVLLKTEVYFIHTFADYRCI